MSAAEPTFSVVIPAFNAAATVAAAVRSALGQTASHLEVVVVDDGSTDATAEIVGRIADSRVRLLSQPNGGLPRARNAGIAAARGRYVALLDSDDLLLEGYLERAGRALDGDPLAAFAYADAYVFDPDTGRTRRRTAMARAAPPVPAPRDRDAFLLELLRRNFIFVAAVIRRDALEAVGGFNEARTSVEDYELWLRLLLAGHRAICIPEPQALYRKHPAQMSRKLATMSRNLLAVYRELPIEQLPSPAHRRLLARRRLQVAWETMALSAAGWAVPQRIIGVAKRAGVGETWYDVPPPEVSRALGLLSHR